VDIRVRKYTCVSVLKLCLGRAFSCIERERETDEEKRERGIGTLVTRTGRALERERGKEEESVRACG